MAWKYIKGSGKPVIGLQNGLQNLPTSIRVAQHSCGWQLLRLADRVIEPGSRCVVPRTDPHVVHRKFIHLHAPSKRAGLVSGFKIVIQTLEITSRRNTSIAQVCASA
jgi:hypothetical protein